MQIDRLFQLTATAWLATAVARVVLAIVQAGPPDDDGSTLALALGAGVELAVAGWLWFRPGQGSAIAACVLGVYAVIGIAYLPIVGPQPWFVALSVPGLVAFGLSIACLRAARRIGRAAGRAGFGDGDGDGDLDGDLDGDGHG